MVRTRAQRVANDENGVAQSPPQALSTPRRKPVKANAKPLNASIKHATRDTIITKKSKDKTEQPKQPRTKSTEPSRTGAKKARLRSVAKKVKSQTENSAALPEDLSDIENRDSEDVENNTAVTAVSKADQTLPSTAKTRSKDDAKTERPAKSPVNGDKSLDNIPLSTPFSASKPNGGLFDIFSRLSPQNPEAQSQRAGSEGAASATSEKEASVASEQTKITKNHKPKSKEQRALQEHGSNKQKPAIAKSGSSLFKRKRVQDHEDDDDVPEVKKKTARWSFKPDSDGHLSLLPRADIDPDDATVIFVEGQEAAKLISEEFERKKQVRFADRIAKQHSELSPDEQAAQRKEFETQHLQVTTQGLFGNDLPRNGDMRALARKLDAGHQTMLEKVESLTRSDDQDLRESLARDLIELAYAIRAAGPQSKEHSPVDQPRQLTWTNSQSDKENKSAATSPENSPSQTTSTPTANSESKDAHTTVPASTPGRLFASIRKLRSYLPFGSSDSPSAAPSPNKEMEQEQEHITTPPDSPTPAPRRANDSTRSSNDIRASNTQPGKQLENPPDSHVVVQQPENRDLDGATDLQTPQKALPPKLREKQDTTQQGDSNNKIQPNKQQEISNALTIPQTPDIHKGKIGSEAYPLTADGKIPRPAPRVWGLNDAYFYDAEDSDDSDENKEPEFIPRRKRLTRLRDATFSKEAAEKLRLTRSAPRPSTYQSSAPRMTAPPPLFNTPAPRVFKVPEISDDSDSPDETPEMPSAERRDIERQKMRAERLQGSKDAARKPKISVIAHKPKTPSRLREMASVPPSPTDPRVRLQKYFTPAGTQGVLNVFLHV